MKINHLSKYKGTDHANIINLDYNRVKVIDLLISYLYKVLLALVEKNYSEATLYVFRCLRIVNAFNEYIVTVKLSQIFAKLLFCQEMKQEALQVFEFLRDFAEDTSNDGFLLQIYMQMGKLL